MHSDTFGVAAFSVGICVGKLIGIIGALITSADRLSRGFGAQRV